MEARRNSVGRQQDYQFIRRGESKTFETMARLLIFLNLKDALKTIEKDFKLSIALSQFEISNSYQKCQ